MLNQYGGNSGEKENICMVLKIINKPQGEEHNYIVKKQHHLDRVI